MNCSHFVMSVHFWAPTFKWGISIANIADFQKPPETLSYPQQIGILTLSLSYLFSPRIAAMCELLCLYDASCRFHCIAMYLSS